MTAMSTITIRDIPEDTHAALKVMAAEAHKGGRRSVEGLARTLLVDATRRRGPGLGSQLAAVGRQFQASLAAAGESMSDEEIDALFGRSDEQNEPATFK
jgi:plasmid stability protein